MSLNAQDLKALAGKAAELYEQGTPLTDAVTSVLQGVSGLTEEHVRRVVEFANNRAFELEFRRMTGPHRVVDFEGGPADSKAVIRELRIMQPNTEKVAARIRPPRRKYIPGEDGVLSSLKSGGKTKVASAVTTRQPDRKKVESLYVTVKRAHEELQSRVHASLLKYAEASDKLRGVVKQALFDGVSPFQVANVFEQILQPEIAKMAMREVLPVIESVPFTKVATEFGVPNPEHPLCRSLSDFGDTVRELHTHIAASERMQHQLQSVRNALS